jgi:DNA-binding IclR family transcriptional regulator
MVNTVIVHQAIAKHPMQTCRKLAEISGLSYGSTRRAIDELVKHKIIVMCGTVKETARQHYIYKVVL